MTFDTHADQEIADIKASNGRVEPSILLQRIANLEQECRNAQLPSRTIERYQTVLSELRSQFRVSRTARFRFKSSMSDPSEDLGVAGETRTANDGNPVDAPTINPSLDPTRDPTTDPTTVETTASKQINQTITSGNNIQNIESCIVILETPHSVHITNAQKCTIVAQCHQLRLTNCQDCQVYAGCPRPAIEQCTDLVIGTIEGARKWDQVDDFGWLRGGVNPHWSQGEEISKQKLDKLKSSSS